MYLKEIISILICFSIGAACARFSLPLPAPPHWFGVLLIVCLWAGYALFQKTPG